MSTVLPSTNCPIPLRWHAGVEVRLVICQTRVFKNLLSLKAPGASAHLMGLRSVASRRMCVWLLAVSCFLSYALIATFILDLVHTADRMMQFLPPQSQADVSQADSDVTPLLSSWDELKNAVLEKKDTASTAHRYCSVKLSY